MKNIDLKVFVDSDVIISSLISNTGASFQLLNNTKGVKLSISNLSVNELVEVTKRLKIKKNKLMKILSVLNIVKLKDNQTQVKDKFGLYSKDINDAHIVAGAAAVSGATFLVTYNIKHFQTEKIKSDFDIITLTPGNYLQYLRFVNL